VFHPDYSQYACENKSLKALAKCLGSSACWLLAPAGIGTIVALLLAFSLNDLEECNQRPCPKGTGLTGIYTAFATLALALYVYYTLNDNQDHLMTSYLPLSVGFAILLVFYGSIYFFLYRLNPNNFSGDFDDDPITQFITFIYYSITVFSTSQDGNIRPYTLGARSIVGMEILSFIYSFTLSIAIIISSYENKES
jgi:voltage-gated potassium channel